MIPVLIVPTLIHYDHLQNMLDSIDIEINELIIIDNGGKLKSIKCNNAKKISIINLPRNLGVAGSWNLGIKLTPYAKWWFIASDDILFLPGQLKRIIDSNFDSIVFDKYIRGSFSAFGVHENIIEKLGLFNEYFYPGIGEEIDYIEKIYKNGIVPYNIRNLFEHIDEGSNTLKSIKSKINNKELFDELQRSSISFNNKSKLDKWDLDYRRHVEKILNS